MKQGKKPTRRQKMVIESAGLNVENWLVFKNDGDYISLVHRGTGDTRKITKN
ncbi:DUF6906 family protein [Niallia sp. 01092]|uniref:DUF6906 family protein n=1 Tax=unclassified Niallia TaxID=2837522 RepID=UPI003FD25A24